MHSEGWKLCRCPNTPNSEYSNSQQTTTVNTISAPQPIVTSVSTKKIVASEEYSRNCDSKKDNMKIIKTKRNVITHIKTTANINRPFIFNQPDTSANEVYDRKEQQLQLNTSRTSSSINEIELTTIDATVTENNEKKNIE
ncbi:hypothetical protein O181_014560 [Austropuccinia psidii MF-1]|uniref:Uncharacterized protein n=1 Tax=Austropuccinia psidii MF-1 TaxID=1389203 RepID=A0A9Q3C169_9BASI|nr:hypothetical protein [Austropuccinia psidii MF-1]